MATLDYDPFLCDDCQKLGYCRVRAIQAQVNRLRNPQVVPQPSPGPALDSEAMVTLREFVAEHRPDLSKLLPSSQEEKPGVTPAKTPTLGELRAMIAARKVVMQQAQPEPALTSSPRPVVLPKTQDRPQRIAAPRFEHDLKRMGEKPLKRQRTSTWHRQHAV